MLRYVLLILTISILAQKTSGQKRIYGSVIDGTTRESLPYVNVFVNNTTFGTVTNKEGQYTLVVPTGEYEIVFSFVGYQSHKVKTFGQGSGSLKIDVELIASSQELESVTINSNADKQWAKLFRQFESFFLGNTDAADSCAIRNAWCIDLKRVRISGQQVLTADASQPLDVENLALGYKLHYDLHDFSASKESVKFIGNIYFTELQPRDSIQREYWARNRLHAYQGSSRHLFKSILDKRLKEEGYTLFTYQTPFDELQRISSIPREFTFEFDSPNKAYKIPTGQHIVVRYESPFKKSATLVSRLHVPNGYVEVDNNGVILDPFSVVATGYMSTFRVANLLPTDYQPIERSDWIERRTVAADDVNSRKKQLGVSVEDSAAIVIQALGRLDSLEKKASFFLENRPTEKVYIHFDKAFYVTGEDSWYKAYVVHASDLSPTDISSVVYIDWIDPSGKVIKHQRLKIEGGAGVGDFRIDTRFLQGTYTVRAYTRWMRNEDPEFFYSKKIQIFNAATTSMEPPEDTGPSKIDLQFFPEGGTIVAGLQTQLAFKAIDSYGRSLEVEGKIVDQENRIVTTFRSTHRGMGALPLIPDTNQSLRAVLQGGEVFALPDPAANGFTLAASHTGSRDIRVRIQSTQNNESYAYLIGQSCGSIYYAECIIMDGQPKDISISKDDLPEGILELTLLNGAGIPQCTRMLFIEKDKSVDVSIKSDKQDYRPKDSVTLNIKVTDLNGNPVETSLSVSVTDASIVSAEKNSENIYTRLLLQSDIRGNIEGPGWYFDSNSVERKYALDLVMLTHGWSRYNWKTILEGGEADSVTFMPERGMTLEGRILAKNKPVINAPFMVIIPQRGYDFIDIYETDSLGHFTVNGMDFSDSTMISLRVMKGKGVVPNASIQLTRRSDILPVTDYRSPILGVKGARNDLYEKLIARFDKTGVWSFDYFKVLNEVTIESTRIKVKSVGLNRIVVKPGPEDFDAATAQFVGRYALKPPKVISINGYVVEEGDPYTILNSIPIKSIDNIFVTGTPRGGYSVSIRTKTTFDQGDVGTIREIVNGYDAVREFYHPKYGPSDIFSSLPDYRMTLYWNANLQTDKNGIATAKFYNSDLARDFLITVEGIENGATISSSKILGRSGEH
ncbi:MAG: carboxypeptidase-like regulatory domain-containing protein [Cyclobacteriaceae bacterium]